MARRWWEVLELARGADERQVKAAYRALARRFHPDVGGQEASIERFQELTDAYEQALRELAAGARGTLPVLTVSFLDAYLGASLEVELPLEDAPVRCLVEVPAGAYTGLLGRAERADGSASAQVMFEVAPDRRFRRLEEDPADLETDLVLTAAELVLGADGIPVTTPAARIAIRVPAGVAPGSRLRLAGRGMPRVGEDRYGDLYALVRLHLPSRLERRERALYEQLLRSERKPAR
jgi:curved DNA-binding protein